MSMLTVVIRRMHKMGVHKMGVVGGFKNPVGWRKEADRYSYHPWAISDQKSILHTWTGTNSSIHRLPGSGLMSPVGWRKEADRYSYHPWAISDQKSILHTWTGTNSSIHRLPGSGLMSPRDKNVKHNSTFYNIIPVGWRKEADRYWPYPHHHT